MNCHRRPVHSVHPKQFISNLLQSTPSAETDGRTDEVPLISCLIFTSAKNGAHLRLIIFLILACFSSGPLRPEEKGGVWLRDAGEKSFLWILGKVQLMVTASMLLIRVLVYCWGQTEKLHMETIIKELTSGPHNMYTWESNYIWQMCRWFDMNN